MNWVIRKACSESKRKETEGIAEREGLLGGGSVRVEKTRELEVMKRISSSSSPPACQSDRWPKKETAVHFPFGLAPALFPNVRAYGVLDGAISIPSCQARRAFSLSNT